MDHVELGQLGASFEVLDRGLRLVTGQPRADLLVVKAAIHHRMGRLLEAREALASALAIDPTNRGAAKLLPRLGTP